VEWTDAGLEGSARFLSRVWRFVEPLCPTLRGAPASAAGLDLTTAERALRRKTHQTIQKVTGDLYPRVHLNTAISALMELVNELYAFGEQGGLLRSGRRAGEGTTGIEQVETCAVLREACEALVLMLSLFCPHFCEELWQALGHDGGLAAARWPVADEAAARADEVEYAVQVNGKVRARLTVAADAADQEIEAAARTHPQVQAHIAGRTVRKVVIVRGRLVGIVAN